MTCPVAGVCSGLVEGGSLVPQVEVRTRHAVLSPVPRSASFAGYTLPFVLFHLQVLDSRVLSLLENLLFPGSHYLSIVAHLWLQRARLMEFIGVFEGSVGSLTLTRLRSLEH